MQPTQPTLDEMLADPMVRLVMRRDGVDESCLRALLRRVRDQRAAAPGPRFSARSNPAVHSLSTGGSSARLA
jgi:hypothetical protein